MRKCNACKGTGIIWQKVAEPRNRSQPKGFDVPCPMRECQNGVIIENYDEIQDYDKEF